MFIIYSAASAFQSLSEVLTKNAMGVGGVGGRVILFIFYFSKQSEQGQLGISKASQRCSDF